MKLAVFNYEDEQITLNLEHMISITFAFKDKVIECKDIGGAIIEFDFNNEHDFDNAAHAIRIARGDFEGDF